MREKLTKRNQQTGFTIIEVVLVLAIAGLIFLIVFLALPQLQRSRRDTQRKSDIDRFAATLSTYASNNNGEYPTITNQAELESHIDAYLGGELNDPQSGATYTLNNAAFLGGATSPGDIGFINNFNCDFEANAGQNIYITVVWLESGRYCVDNQ